jgi:hypothetical protein
VVIVKKKKTIVIKNPKLRKARNNLRYIISEAVISKWVELDQNGEKIRSLADKRDKLDTAWKKSICVCPVCGSRTSDMTFNPYDKYWYCVKCYGENQGFFRERNEGFKYP